MNPELFNRVAQTVPTITNGWCSVEKACDLAAAVVTLRPDVVVEIGVFGGRSLIPMAMACREVGQGLVYAIDPWSASAAVEGYDGPNAEWWGKLDHEAIFQSFLAQVRDQGLAGWVHVVRQHSDDAVESVPSTIDILHIDGQHTKQAVKDVLNYASLVRTGGLCYMDDIEWGGGGVQHACQNLLFLGFEELYRHKDEHGTGGMFQRVK
jgi:predicted O-methyltransferase YrrM